MIILSKANTPVLQLRIIFQSQLPKQNLWPNSRQLEQNIRFQPSNFAETYKFKRQNQKTDKSKLRNYFSPFLDVE